MQLLGLALSELPEHPTLLHPVTGDPLRAIYQTKEGIYKWPVIGGAPEDDSDDDEDDDEEDDDTSGGGDSGGSEGSGEKDKKGKGEGEDPAAGLKSALEKERDRRRNARRERDEARARIAELEGKNTPELEQVTRERDTLKAENESLRETLHSNSRRLAFLSVPGLDWADPEDALAIAERFGLRDVEVEEDGEIDSSEVQRIAKELAEKKDHLLRKSVSQKDNNGSGDGDPNAASGSTGKTKKTKTKDDRFTDETLRNKFPALRR
jgi:hypothetical protein